MTPSVHISVCVCTFRRPDLLAQLLEGLAGQKSEGKFTYSIVLVDNDRQESGRRTVERFQRGCNREINYIVEPEQSIALARNRAVAHARGEFVAFIDDDEVPVAEWLVRLYDALERFKADGVLGPVKPQYPKPPPTWALRAGLFERPNSQDYKSGLTLHWSQTGTGNVLVRRRVFDEVSGPFKAEFGSGGEDIDFFRRAMSQGKVFVWCAEAMAYETISPERIRISFHIRRALLRGKVSLAGSGGGPLGILKSVSACGLYTIFLPMSLMIGRHMFIRYLIKSCDHLGKLLGLCGIDLVREKYVQK